MMQIKFKKERWVKLWVLTKAVYENMLAEEQNLK